MKTITTKKEFKNSAEEVFNLMNKGEGNLTKKEEARVRLLASAIQEYEKKIYPLEMPKTLEGMIEIKMYEHKISQSELARKLQLSTAKLSLILNGKQKPDIGFLKGVRKELNIDADFILDHA
ncbi:MAG: helix-turn-helix domain-containing protein [Bacteroidota bacterium]|nr:helix-turn-helix domain-containing protein [Bacteroidota bacterium]